MQPLVYDHSKVPTRGLRRNGEPKDSPILARVSSLHVSEHLLRVQNKIRSDTTFAQLPLALSVFYLPPKSLACVFFSLFLSFLLILTRVEAIPISSLISSRKRRKSSPRRSARATELCPRWDMPITREAMSSSPATLIKNLAPTSGRRDSRARYFPYRNKNETSARHQTQITAAYKYVPCG